MMEFFGGLKLARSYNRDEAHIREFTDSAGELRSEQKSLQAASDRLAVASQALSTLRDGEPRRILEKLGGFLVERVEAARI